MIDEQYLTRVIAKLVEQTVEKKVRPSSLTIGVVETTSPLSVKISDAITLPEKALITGDQFQKFSFTTSENGEYPHTHTTEWDNTLKIGDKVRLLSDTGGQQYFILGRL